ncbi:MAG: hypothetical protein KDI30_03465, partial [Pseudomonadales bacterium]|nr:hypothetical protein [Pseudomonadales bacterium]
DTAEGERTRIMYLGSKTLSPLGALRHYQKTFAALGEVEEIYTCKHPECFKNLGKDFVWRQSNHIPHELGGNAYLLPPGSNGFKNQVYWHGKVKTASAEYVISLYSAIMHMWSSPVERIQDRPLIHLEIVKQEI